MTEALARAAAETVARTAYGRLIAYLSARSRDVAAAEDALSDAFQSALRTWPSGGVPERPEAWLLVAARRRLGEAERHGKVRAGSAATLELLQLTDAPDAADIPDDRLRLLLVCAHPAIDPASRAPLMLQTVLGLDAKRIAAAFLTAPAAMSQRLVRAKLKIRDAGIAFELPDRHALPDRLDAVLSALYAAYGAGWDEVEGSDAPLGGLTGEAIWLARLVADLAPQEPEAHGLAALMLHCEARRPARRDAQGRFTPLSQQDPGLWSQPLIAEAETRLRTAASLSRLGRFQLEAAIQSMHAQRAVTGRMPWEELARLYEGLVLIAPSVGAKVGRAAALAEARGADAGLASLDAIDAPGARTYQPLWALRAHLLDRLGRRTDAQDARRIAIGLTENAAVRSFLQGLNDGAPP